MGPETEDCVNTGTLATLFCDAWGNDARWEQVGNIGPHEDAVLKLDCAKIKGKLGWKPCWHVDRAVRETVVWTKAWQQKNDIRDCMTKQIQQFLLEGTTDE